MDGFYTIKGAAKRLGVKQRRIRRWLASGKLWQVRVRGKLMIPEAVVDRLADREVNPLFDSEGDVRAGRWFWVTFR